MIASFTAPTSETISRKRIRLFCCFGFAMCAWNSASVCAFFPMERTRCAIERSIIANLVSPGEPSLVNAMP